MKPCFLFLTLIAGVSHSQAATVVSPGNAAAIPGVVDFAYDNYYVLGNDHTASWMADTDAYSWDHPNLASADPVLGAQTGWTHLSRWIALTVTESVTLTIRLDAVGGIMIPDQNDPGNFIAAGDDLVPAFTLWTGFEVNKENSALGLGDPNGGHRWDNDGNLTTWMDQLVYLSNDGNLGGASFVEKTMTLAAGNYTMNIAGNKGGVFNPVGVRDGYSATLTTSPVPEPSALLLLGLSAITMLRRQR